MNKYYKFDSRKLTYGEYWNILRSWKVIIPWTAKLLHLPMNFGTPLPYFESVKDLEVPENEFDSRARQKLQSLLDQCLASGFHSQRFFTYGSMNGTTRTWFMALLHSSGATVRLMYTVALNVQPPKEKVLVVLLSELRDGTFFFTSSQRRQFISSPNVTGNRLIGASPENLLASHLQKLKELPLSNPPKPVTSVEMLDDLWDRYEKNSREFGMKRGIYVWMTPEEVAREETGMAEAKTMAGPTGENTDVMMEIQKLRRKKSGWTGLITVFLVSLVLFIIAGKRQWSWDYVVILVGVLFVHELGHYLAMRAFHYQNVRMFFIPFFGAAVAGQHYNVAGWKKVVVSLMGPLPGIALGVIIGVAGIVAHQTILVKIGLVSLLLNGSNLLPVLPMDGGWVFQTLIFSRHYMLDILFRIVAAVLLIASVSFLHTRILPYVGVLMIIGIPAAQRTLRIAAMLKVRGVSPVAEDEQNIPPEMAQVIIAEVKQASAKPQATKVVAQQTLQVFEALNARPPGWAATLGLLFVHLTSLGLAAVFAFSFIIAQRGDFRELMNSAAFMPKHKLPSAACVTWNETVHAAGGITLVATLNRVSDAAALFAAATNGLADTASIEFFGESVLASLPAGEEDLRRQWLTNFQARTKEVFVDSTNYHAAFSLFCIAPSTNAAATIVNELEGYFRTLPGESLIPPWQPEDQRTDSERAANDLARQTYLKLQNAQIDSYRNNELQRLEKNAIDARIQGDEAQALRLQAQIKTLTDQLKQQSLDRLRNGEQGPVDVSVFELFTNLNATTTMTNQAASEAIRRNLAERMGQLWAGDKAGTARYGASYGSATHTGLLVNITLVSFDDLPGGPPALAAWLEQRHCIGFKYDFYPGMAMNSDDE